MYGIIQNAEVVFTAETAGEILVYLENSGSPAGSLICQLWTVGKFRGKHVFCGKVPQPKRKRNRPETSI